MEGSRQSIIAARNMKRLFPIFLLAAACSSHADILSCADGKGHTFLVSQQAEASQSANSMRCTQHSSKGSPREAAARRNTHAEGAAGGALINSEFKVGPSEQAERDITRRNILLDELAFEEKSLGAVESRKRTAGGNQLADLNEESHRHQQNIEALNRELGRIDSSGSRSLGTKDSKHKGAGT